MPCSGWSIVVSNNIYHVTELFPGTGLITINVESWDFVGNGILSTKEITYQEVLSTEYTQVTSPSETLTLEFDENDIDKSASILLQEKALSDDSQLISDDLLLDFHQVSQTYEINLNVFIWILNFI